jgi:hypothetical protein
MRDTFIKLLGYLLLLFIFASLFRNPGIGFVIGIVLFLAFKFWK